jgi:hypothetical protein
VASSGAQQTGGSLNLKPRRKIWTGDKLGSHQHRDNYLAEVAHQKVKKRRWSAQNLKPKNT